MNLLTNICNPKQQHFQQQARTQAYKPLNDYVFQSRSMQRMRARHQPIQNLQQYKYQSWNHPYSISNFFMTQRGAEGKQSLGGNTEYVGYQNDSLMNSDQRIANKKISFKEIPQAFCGIGKQEEQGQKIITKRQDFYSSLRSNQHNYGKSGFAYQGRNYSQQDNHPIHTDNPQFSRIQHLQNDHISSQNSHTYILLSQQILKLKHQNKQLKRIIQQEYKPMKELYNKLLSEQQEREYLISKLEWKVKELVKEMGAASGSFGTGTLTHPEQNHNFESKKETKMISRVDSQKHFGQTSSHQPFKTFQTNFANIKIQQSKPSALTNLQSPYKNANPNTVNESRPYGQFNFTSTTGNNTYHKVSTQQSAQNTFQSPTFTSSHLNMQQYQNLTNPQQNHYVSAGTNNFAQVNNFSLQNNTLGQNYQKPLQNYQTNPFFNQNTGYQSHYQTTNTRFNH